MISNEYEATILAEKLRAVIEQTEVIYNEETLHVTLSLGVTVVKMDDSADSIVDRADHLMYESKSKGKNRVTSD